MAASPGRRPFFPWPLPCPPPPYPTSHSPTMGRNGSIQQKGALQSSGWLGFVQYWETPAHPVSRHPDLAFLTRERVGKNPYSTITSRCDRITRRALQLTLTLRLRVDRRVQTPTGRRLHIWSTLILVFSLLTDTWPVILERRFARNNSWSFYTGTPFRILIFWYWASTYFLFDTWFMTFHKILNTELYLLVCRM